MRSPTRRAGIAATAIMACAWLGFTAFGEDAARAIAGRFSDVLLRAGGGKFDDPAIFVHGRLEECLILATLAIVLCLTAAWMWKWLGKSRAAGSARGLVMGVAVFVFLNLFVWACGRTVLFWGMFYDKVRIDNFAQYHIKRTLLDEIHGKRRAILIGSSQANRSIDEVLMNQTIGDSIWTTELTQPGARGFDLLTLTRDMPLRQGDLVICYLSEIMFYGEGSGIVAADFLNFSEIPDALDLKGWNLMAPDAIRSGLLGRVLPLYRYRNPLSHRILGWSIVNLDQQHFDQSLEVDLDQQAKRRAPNLGIGATSTFEQAAFARMIGELSEKGCTTLVISGHTHPSMGKYLNPAVKEHLDRFLSDLAARHPERMKLVDGDRFFSPASSDFVDLVHFNDEAQQRFTLELIDYLKASGTPLPN
ncbi:MAG: hypothetical protein V4689_14315 [Verrucomicrobiota bacterium]